MPDPKTEFLRRVFPADPGVQHEQDALQTQTIRHGPRPGSLLRPRRQQRLDQLPQFVIDDRRLAHTPTERD
jgi:hypothetical protein